MTEVAPERPYGSWASLTPAFLDALAARLAGLRVLECFAGNGRLAAELSARGVQMRATSLFSGHDGHERGLLHPVEELDALRAVRLHGADADVLLMSWPTVTEAAAAAALEWGDGRPVYWIGEITRFDEGMSGLGGCATDTFHRIAAVEEDLPGFATSRRLERAAVLRVHPAAAALWRAGVRDAGRIVAAAEEEPVPAPAR